MSSGIRVEVAVGDLEGCPVAAASQSTDEAVTAVDRSVVRNGEVVEEFTAPGAVETDADTVFEGEETRYRFARDATEPCVCDAVETFGPPVADIRAEGGTLVITFHADAVDEVRDIVEHLTEAYGDVSLRSLGHDGEECETDAVLVDRGTLTDRQREVLETAVEMGYFTYPKGANASEVAAALDISVSTLSEHLAAAQSKVYADLLD